MQVIVVGAGIGGLTAALSLHRAGLTVEIFEQARALEELGVGFNLLPHATKELASLGLLPALDEAGVRIRELIYANRYGQVVWRELRGVDGGYETPQIAIHRGKLHALLARAVVERIGAAHVHVDRVLIEFKNRANSVSARLSDRSGRLRIDVTGDVLVGCDGIHSAVRKVLYPEEGPPRWSGITLWRGATELPSWADGRTMLVAGGSAAKFVYYPIHHNRVVPDGRLTNWGIMARMGRGGDPPPRREDWSRIARRHEALQFAKDHFQLEGIDPVKVIGATETVYEYPNCDRDPLPRWSFGRVTLLGDAAHPMYPVGSNGASQAILDAEALTRHLSSSLSVEAALDAYENERRPPTSAIVLRNREGGPEQVIDAVESRAPEGFDELESVLPFAEREAIVRGYARLAGYAVDQVNRRSDIGT